MKGLSLDKIKSEQSKRRFYLFFLEFWETIESVTIVNNWHIEYLCDELQFCYEAWERKESQPDIYINVPPGSSKSTICTQLFPVWLWVRNPSIRIISSSYSSDLSTGHAVRSKDCINSEKFQKWYGNLFQIKRGEDNKSWYKNDQFGERYTTSTGGAVTGMHADFTLVDDPLNVKKAESQLERQSANKHIGETLSTRQTDRVRSVMIVIMQRLHEDDPTGAALSERKEQIKHICLPAELSTLVSPVELSCKYIDALLDPNRLGRESLMKLKTKLGSYGYAGQISQNPSPEGGGQLKKDWFGSISYELFTKLKGNTVVNVFLDTAYTANQKNDPSALMATCYIGNTLYIINSEQVWKELPELLKHIPSYSLQHGYNRSSRILIEPKASGKSTVQSFKNTGYNVIELPPPLDDKVTRVNSISAIVEANRVVLVEAPWNDNFLGECGAFPNGSHDDQVDNLVNALTYYVKNNRKVTASY